MEVLLVITITFHIFLPAMSSVIRLNNGGYEDIVIAINPSLQEDMQLISSIQGMVKEANNYLFSATQKRLFIQSVKILIPSSWPSKNYSKSQTETYDKADIIVASPHLEYGDQPYTVQYGRCGEPGKYIHFTPNFLLNDDLRNYYGKRGRVFVHEWAHLRWGVFDEYNTDTPYYIASNGKIEATRCSKKITGRNVKIYSKCVGTSCTQSCKVNSTTNLYENGCVFVPDNNQYAKQSIMYTLVPSSITEFCDSSSHNIEAPNLQNRMCNSRSTWDVILNSTDISSTSPRSDTNIPVPSFTFIQPGNRVVTLVLDISGSMNGPRIERLYQSATMFLTQIIEGGSSVGIVTFSSIAEIRSHLVTLESNTQRERLASLLPATDNGGGTNICLGILAGIEVNKEFDGSTHGTEIILLTDGEDNYDTRSCFAAINKSGAIIHFIALGPSASKALEEIAAMTGGLNYRATDSLEANGLIDSFTALQTTSGDVSQEVLQLESTGSSLNPESCLNGSIVIDSTVGNNTVFLVTWESDIPRITLRDPLGRKYSTANFTSDTIAKSSTLEIPGTAERGSWQYSICNAFTSLQAISIIANSKAADDSTPPITVEAHMNSAQNTYPNPMVVYALVTQGLLPVTGVNVTAIIEDENTNTFTLELLDNGAGADTVKDDGVYSKYFTTFTVNGRYSLKVRVESTNSSQVTVPTSRAYYIPAYVENGTILWNSQDQAANQSNGQVYVGEFSRTASGGSFVVTNVPPSVSSGAVVVDLYKPDKITDLEAKIENGTIVLSWTATGDDLDQGNASSYDLRMSTLPTDLLANFTTSTSVNVSSVIPKPAGSRETFTFSPENIVIENGTILYFALTATDKAAQISDMSNIAQAALVIPRVEDTITDAPSTAKPITVSRPRPPIVSSAPTITNSSTYKQSTRSTAPSDDSDLSGHSPGRMSISIWVVLACVSVAIGSRIVFI